MLCADMLCSGVLVAQGTKESDVEAAYLFNFAKFMHAQPHSAEFFTIGVMGKNPFGNTLEQITAHEQMDGRAMRVLAVASAEDARNCDMIFVSDSEAPRLEKDLEMVQGADVLTVSNVSGFLDRGGMIQFLIVSNRVRFSVNLSAANRSKITLSSELLKVAVSVSGLPPGEVKP
jgi:hypothetical protein